MELTKIQGNTYYIPGPTNTGVFQYKDHYALIIDTGSTNTDARKIADTLAERNINIKYIVNSHEHADHCGGNLYLQDKYPGSIFYASRDSSLFLQNTYLFPLYIFGGAPLKDLSRDFTRSRENRVDYILEAGTEKINNERFEIIPLPGHAAGQIGIATRDKVCFIGDALFSPEILDKYSFPFLMDIQSQFDTYNTIDKLEFDYYVLGHADKVYPYSDIHHLIALNKSNLEKYLNIILELTDQPRSREDILEDIIILEDLAVDLHEYYFMSSTIAAMISYLDKQSLMTCAIENGRMYFYKK